MRFMGPDQLVEFAGLLVTLMIFFSIDAKHRFNRKHDVAKGVFRITSIIGGFSTALALVVVWVELFTTKDVWQFHVLVYFVPASLAVLSALILAFEVLFLRESGAQDELRG